jgi:hypothetical protein
MPSGICRLSASDSIVIVLPECALEILMERLKGPYCAKSMLNNFAGHCKLRLIGVGLFDQR